MIQNMREGNVLVTKNAVPKNAEQGKIGTAIQSQQFVLIRKKNGTAAKKALNSSGNMVNGC